MHARSGAATEATDQVSERYRRAERAFWKRYDLQPTERFVELRSPAVRLRVVEVGSGTPVVFVPGTGGTGPYWAPLVRELTGVRCLLLDRPGWGLSSPVDYTTRDYRELAADVLAGVLDELDLDDVAVVGHSIGTVWALALAARQPSRVSRAVLLGGGPLVHDLATPPFIRLLTSPLGALVVRLPARPWMVRRQLEGVGHGASLEAGRIPSEYIDWRIALADETDSMRHERDMARFGVRGPDGWRTAFDDATLAGIDRPVRMIFGTEDTAGSVEMWRRFVGRLPAGDLKVVRGAGHLPWFDEPGVVGRHVADAVSA